MKNKDKRFEIDKFTKGLSDEVFKYAVNIPEPKTVNMPLPKPQPLFQPEPIFYQIESDLLFFKQQAFAESMKREVLGEFYDEVTQREASAMSIHLLPKNSKP